MDKEKPSNVWSVYLIRCSDHSLYTGISNNVAKRFLAHTSRHSSSAKYLRSRHPLELAYSMKIGSRSLASRVEARVKRLSKSEKEALIRGDSPLSDLIDLEVQQ